MQNKTLSFPQRADSFQMNRLALPLDPCFTIQLGNMTYVQQEGPCSQPFLSLMLSGKLSRLALGHHSSAGCTIQSRILQAWLVLGTLFTAPAYGPPLLSSGFYVRRIFFCCPHNSSMLLRGRKGVIAHDEVIKPTRVTDDVGSYHYF